MDLLDQAALTGVERRLAAAMAAEFGLGLSGMALDMTNFATYIDTGNEKAPIAQRGHAKQKRADLRLVGLGMVVTRDGGIPLVGHAYPGNHNDVKVFPDVIDELVARYRAIAAADQELTVVFDAGQNSADNFTHLADAGLQFAGSLPPSDYPDLLAIPARRLAVIDAGRFPGLTGYETRATALGADRRVPRLRPDHRQGRPQARRAGCRAGRRPGTPRPPRRRSPHRADHPAPMARPGAPGHPDW